MSIQSPASTEPALQIDRRTRVREIKRAAARAVPLPLRPMILIPLGLIAYCAIFTLIFIVFGRNPPAGLPSVLAALPILGVVAAAHIVIGRTPIPESPVEEPAALPSTLPGDSISHSLPRGDYPNLPAQKTNPEWSARLRDLRSTAVKSSSVDADLALDYQTRSLSVDPTHQFGAHLRTMQRRVDRLGGLMVVICAWNLQPLLSMSVLTVLLLGPAGVLVYLALARLLRMRVPQDRTYISRAFAYTPYSSEGSVGGNLGGAEGTFSDYAVKYGIAGEVKTARLLENWLVGVSRVAIFHSVRFPGSDRADVDHVVLIGHKVFILDSKAWKGAQYRQLDGGGVYLDGGGGYRESSMGVAVEKFRADPALYDTQALTVIHPTSGAASIRDELDNVGRFSNVYVSAPLMLMVLLTEREVLAEQVWTAADDARFTARCDKLRSMLV